MFKVVAQEKINTRAKQIEKGKWKFEDKSFQIGKFNNGDKKQKKKQMTNKLLCARKERKRDRRL